MSGFASDFDDLGFVQFRGAVRVSDGVAFNANIAGRGVGEVDAGDFAFV